MKTITFAVFIAVIARVIFDNKESELSAYRQHHKTYRSPIGGWILSAIALIVAVLLIGGLGSALDRMDDNSHEWADSVNLQALREAEESSERRQAAAQALCREAHGEAVAMWTPEGHLVCRPRRGNLKVQIADTSAGRL